MPNHALAILTGHVGKEPEYKQVSDGLLKFSLAVATGYGDKKQTTWWEISLWGKRASTLQSMIHRGDPITVIGEPSLRKWTSGEKSGVSLEVRAADIVLLGGRDRAPSDQPGASESTPEDAAGEAATGPDVPF